MQAPPPPVQRLHWIPVAPSWIVAAGLVLLGAMPHQLPVAGVRILHNPIGLCATLAVAAWVAWRGSHVLGAAIALFVAGVWLYGPVNREGFAQGRKGPGLTLNEPMVHEGFAAPILNKDRVKHGHRWISEEIMSEEPAAIQERTEGPALVEDEVQHHDHQWEVEHILEEHPAGIQDRPVASLPEYTESHPPYRS